MRLSALSAATSDRLRCIRLATSGSGLAFVRVATGAGASGWRLPAFHISPMTPSRSAAAAAAAPIW